MIGLAHGRKLVGKMRAEYLVGRAKQEPDHPELKRVLLAIEESVATTAEADVPSAKKSLSKLIDRLGYKPSVERRRAKKEVLLPAQAGAGRQDSRSANLRPAFMDLMRSWRRFAPLIEKDDLPSCLELLNGVGTGDLSATDDELYAALTDYLRIPSGKPPVKVRSGARDRARTRGAA